MDEPGKTPAKKRGEKHRKSFSSQDLTASHPCVPLGATDGVTPESEKGYADPDSDDIRRKATASFLEAVTRIIASQILDEAGHHEAAKKVRGGTIR